MPPRLLVCNEARRAHVRDRLARFNVPVDVKEIRTTRPHLLELTKRTTLHALDVSYREKLTEMLETLQS